MTVAEFTQKWMCFQLKHTNQMSWKVCVTSKPTKTLLQNIHEGIPTNQGELA